MLTSMCPHNTTPNIKMFFPDISKSQAWKKQVEKSKIFFYKIHLKDNELVYQKQFKIRDKYKSFLEKSLAEWLKLGVVQKSDSLYNSPVFVSLKKEEMNTELYKNSRN
jgi:hypothetical protein